jgi:hypothetical protein
VFIQLILLSPKDSVVLRKLLTVGISLGRKKEERKVHTTPWLLWGLFCLAQLGALREWQYDLDARLSDTENKGKL